MCLDISKEVIKDLYNFFELLSQNGKVEAVYKNGKLMMNNGKDEIEIKLSRKQLVANIANLKELLK